MSKPKPIDIHTWAEYTTTVGGESVRVRVLQCDTRTYTIPMLICDVLDGRFKGEMVVKTPGQLALCEEYKGMTC